MAPSHAAIEEMPKEPNPSTSVQRAPMLLAKSTLLPKPMMNRRTPSSIWGRRMVRLFSSFEMSEYLTMGPAISWGKRTTKAPKVMRLSSASTFPL